MRQEIADLIHPVIEYGLALRERLRRGEEPSLDAEQAALLGLLQGEREARGSSAGHESYSVVLCTNYTAAGRKRRRSPARRT